MAPPIWSGKFSKKKKKFSMPPPPPFTGINLNEERNKRYTRDFLLCRLPKSDGDNAWEQVTPAGETQENMIKVLATELKIREAFEGKAAQVSANFKSFASSLPHKTILTILKFIGVPQLWLDVFTRFLEAPLNMGPIVRGTSDQVLTRTAGVPIAHGLELFFSELVLFFLDFLVHSRTGGYLLRRRDQCYFVGNTEQCALATAAINEFAEVCQLDVEFGDAAQLSIGCLNFVNDDNKGWSAKINYTKVEACAWRAKKHLDACTTVLDWIRTWNSTVGVYAAHLFGPLSNVFGKAHVEAVTQAYNRVHEIIFEGSNLTDHVKQLLITHIRPNLRDPPFAIEPLLYLPIAYGGLGLKNPYVTLNLVGELLDPQEEIKKFLDSEKTYYDRAKSTFEAMNSELRENKLNGAFRGDKDAIASAFKDRDPAIFMTFEELVAHREQIPYSVLPLPQYPAPIPPFAPIPAVIPLYDNLMDEPINKIGGSDRVCDDIRSRSGTNGKKSWWRHSPEDQWVLQMYSDECFERYGGLEIWHAECVPLEILKIVRGEEDDDDYASSVSDITEV